MTKCRILGEREIDLFSDIEIGISDFVVRVLDVSNLGRTWNFDFECNDIRKRGKFMKRRSSLTSLEFFFCFERALLRKFEDRN